jgi:hypothetical protein
MTDAGQAPEPTALIVVRVGAIDRFAALRAAFVPDGVEVVWDRRSGERRQPAADPMSAERRRRDRRGAEPASWTLLDFIVVPPRPWAS